MGIPGRDEHLCGQRVQRNWRINFEFLLFQKPQQGKKKNILVGIGRVVEQTAQYTHVNGARIEDWIIHGIC